MQVNESFTFPQPPRNFRDKLDPLLSEQDFEETVGIVRRFAGTTQEFTDQDLLEHLAKNGVKLYGPPEGWDGVQGWYAMFAEIRETITNEGAKQKSPVSIIWNVKRLGEKAIYSMAVTMTEKAEAPQVETESVTPIIRRPTEIAQETMPRELRMVLSGIQTMLRDSMGGRVRLTELANTIASRIGRDPTETRQLIAKTIAEGRFSKVNSRGVTYITAPAGERINRQPQRSGSKDTVAPVERPRDAEKLAELDAYMRVVEFVMQSLVALRDITMGQPFDKLWRRCEDRFKDIMDFDAFKGNIRRMEREDGLVVIMKGARLHTKTGRSKELYGSKVMVADKKIRSSWKVSGRANLKAMYEEKLETLLEEYI